MPLEKVKTYIYWLGSGLSLLALIFVAAKLWDYGHEIDISLLTAMSLPISLLAVLFGCVSVILALAWRDLLRHFGLVIETRMAIRIYGLSQLSKYVPGNIFQFVGRQALGLESGLPMWPLAKSAVWEIGMLAFCGCLFLQLVVPHSVVWIPVPLGLICFLISIPIASWICNRWFGRWVARVVCWYSLLLALSGLLFLAVLLLVSPEKSLDGASVILICGAYVTAWLAGLVTPGAPAGMGIREFVLFAVLNSVIKESDLLTAIVISRLVTLGGDLSFFLLALSIKSRMAKPV